MVIYIRCHEMAMPHITLYSKTEHDSEKHDNNMARMSKIMVPKSGVTRLYHI